MNYSYYIGLDISKEWFDAAILRSKTPNKTMSHHRFDNNKEGFKAFVNWLKKVGITDLSSILVCMEHTGLYSVKISLFLGEEKITYTLVPGIAISNSLGISRSGNDKLDAKRISRYAFKNKYEIRIHTLPVEAIRELKTLLSYRERLVKSRHGLKVSLKELRAHESQNIINSIYESSQKMIDELTEEMKKVRKAITEVMKNNPAIKRNYDLLLSVPGIGDQNTLYMIVLTKNFVSFNCPKKFSTYSGIVPFKKKESGKSITSKSRISHLANKKMKSLLTSAVVTSLSHCSEYRLYYERQIARGKNENSVKNVLRNKIVSRAFAVIKRGTPYIDTHAFAS